MSVPARLTIRCTSASARRHQRQAAGGAARVLADGEAVRIGGDHVSASCRFARAPPSAPGVCRRATPPCPRVGRFHHGCGRKGDASPTSGTGTRRLMAVQRTTRCPVTVTTPSPERCSIVTVVCPSTHDVGGQARSTTAPGSSDGRVQRCPKTDLHVGRRQLDLAVECLRSTLPSTNGLRRRRTTHGRQRTGQHILCITHAHDEFLPSTLKRCVD